MVVREPGLSTRANQVVARSPAEARQDAPPTPRVLVLLGGYWPGNEATGPNQSFRALARGLDAEYRFLVVARTTVAEEAVPTSGAEIPWRHDGYAHVSYARITLLGASGLARILNETPHDLLLLNGFHDKEFTIPALLLRRLGRVPRRPTILSPRGELAGGALSLKSGRKHAYQSFARAVGLLDDVWLHATEAHEHRDLESARMPCRGILDAPNARTLHDPPEPITAAPAPAGPLRIAFVGRITPVKNLHFLTDVLARIRSPAIVDLYGPIGDAAYWSRCEAAIKALPAHVTVTAKGAIPNAAVPATLAGYDLFFLPTLGENFGHAINEALGAGVPVLISDRTPWQDLESQAAGWSLPLDGVDSFVSVIEEFTRLDGAARLRLRRGARRLAERRFIESDAIAAHRVMFHRAISAGTA